MTNLSGIGQNTHKNPDVLNPFLKKRIENKLFPEFYLIQRKFALSEHCGNFKLVKSFSTIFSLTNLIFLFPVVPKSKFISSTLFFIPL